MVIGKAPQTPQAAGEQASNGYVEFLWLQRAQLFKSLNLLYWFYLLLVISLSMLGWLSGSAYSSPMLLLWLCTGLCSLAALWFYRPVVAAIMAGQENGSTPTSHWPTHVFALVSATVAGGLFAWAVIIFKYAESTMLIANNPQGMLPIEQVLVSAAYAFSVFTLAYRFSYVLVFFLVSAAPGIFVQMSNPAFSLQLSIIFWLDVFCILITLGGIYLIINRKRLLWLRVQQDMHLRHIDEQVHEAYQANILLEEEMRKRNLAQKRLEELALSLDSAVRQRTEEMNTTNQELQSSLLTLGLTNSIAGLSLWDWRIDDKTIELSNSEITMGYSSDELSKMLFTPERIVHPDDLSFFKAELLQHLQGKTTRFDHRYRIKHKQGHWLWVNDTGLVTEREETSNRAMRMLGVRRDVNEEVIAQESMNLSASVFNQASLAIFITGKDLEFVDVNFAFSKMMGLPKKALIGASIKQYLSQYPWLESRYAEIMTQLMLHASYEAEISDFRGAEGDVFPVWLSLKAIYDRNSKLTNYVGMVSNLAQIKQSEQKASFLQNFDSVTELPNRHQLKQFMLEYMTNEQTKSNPFGMLRINIDRYKVIADSLGDGGSDALLRAVSERLVGFVPDALRMARLDEDNFIVLLNPLSGSPYDYFKNYAETILTSFDPPLQVADSKVNISVSIGVAIYPEHGKTIDRLLNASEYATHEARSVGGNCFRFTSHHNYRYSAANRFELEQDLRKAVVNNEIQAYYQPKVCCKTNKLLGFEALARWIHPAKGLIPPAEFIPLAEEIGVILEIGEKILYSVCRDLADWQEGGVDNIKVSVNVVVLQIQRGDFAKTIEHAVKKYGVDYKNLALEITESSLMNETPEVQLFLEEMKERGIEIAMDDFGTGYSSLSYLSEYKLDVLKIDKAFVDKLGTPQGESIVKAILALGHSLGMHVVAEGVELQSQWDFLLANHCNIVQGYLVSRPMAFADTTEWIMQLPADEAGYFWQTGPAKTA